MRFACEACGHPAVSLPAELHPAASVLCQGCGAVVATWGEFKQRATRMILLEHGNTGCPIAGADPLDLDVLCGTSGAAA